MYKQRIYLLPLGFSEPHLLEVIAAAVEKAFGFSTRQLVQTSITPLAYDPNRRQYSSPVILKDLYQRLPTDTLRLLGVVRVDIYVPQFNYVFGQAAVDGLVSVISLHRLDPEFYGNPPDVQLLEQRAAKEAIHELGHTFGLRHCDNPTCVMYFSNNIEDTDRKSAQFCAESLVQLRANLTDLKAA